MLFKVERIKVVQAIIRFRDDGNSFEFNGLDNILKLLKTRYDIPYCYLNEGELSLLGDYL